jgi:hypothetical protein
VLVDGAGGGAQLQRGDQEAGQGLFVADAEAGDGDVVGGLVAGKDPEGDVLKCSGVRAGGRSARPGSS